MPSSYPESENHLDTVNKEWQIIAGCVTIFIIIVGVSGNLLTIITLLKVPRIRNVTAAFILSLCIADGLFCALVLPFNVLRFFNHQWAHIHILCMSIPFLQYANVGLSLLFIAMITINRYIMIAHYTVYSKIYRPINVAVMIIFCLLLSFGMQVPTLIGVWGEYQYNSKLGTCTISQDQSGNSSKTTLFIVGFVVPCVVIICCYTRIFWVVHSSESKMREHSKSTRFASQDELATKETKRKRNEWRVTKMVLVIFLSFLICYLPITIVKVFDSNINSIVLHIISYLMLYMSACINPIIYVIMNKQYRKAYGHVIKCRATSFLSQSSAKRKEEHPSKTLISQISVSMIPMNVIDQYKIENSKL